MADGSGSRSPGAAGVFRRALLCVLGSLAGGLLLPPEASAQNKATFIDSSVSSFLTGVTSPSAFEPSATQQNVTISATANLGWSSYRLKFCTKTTTPTSNAASYHSTGCGNAISGLPSGRSFTRSVTLTSAMLTNGGLVVVLYHGTNNLVVLAQWVPTAAKGIVLSRSTLALNEGETGMYTMRLNGEPTGNVRVRAQRDGTSTRLRLPGATAPSWGTSQTLNFTQSTWNTAQTIEVQALEDLNAVDVQTSITHSIVTANTVADFDSAADQVLTVNINDDEDAEIVLSRSTPLTLEEGGNATYTVRLSAFPSNTVVVSVSSGDSGAASVSPASLTFQTTNWNTAQTVTVTGVEEDADRMDETVTVTHAVNTTWSSTRGSEFDTAPNETLTVNVTDNDLEPLASNPSPLTEANLNGAMVTVTLPSGTTFVSGVSTSSFALVTSPAIPGLSISNVTGGASGSTSATLTLATGTGYGFNVPSTLAVRALAAANSDSTDIISDTLPVSPTPGMTLSRTSLSVQEAPGATNANRGTYTIVMDSPPTGCAGVSVTASSNNADVTVSPSSAITFSNSNWNTPQTFTVTAAHDGDITDDAATISHSIATNCDAAGYTASLTLPSLTVNVVDDDTPGFFFDADPSTATDDAGPLALDELSTSATNSDDYTVRLASLPTQTVTVTIASGDTSSVTVSDNTLTFTSLNWNTGQTVILTAQDDDNGYDETVTITHAAATPTNSEYTGVNGSFDARVNDDEAPAITLSGPSLSVAEGSSADYTVQLATQPVGGSVTVSITGAANGIAASPTSLTFTSSNWDTARTVTVTAPIDQNGENEQATLSHSASGADYGSATAAEIVVTATDDDAPGLVVSPTQLEVDENDSDTYTIRLNTLPTGDVTVTVSGFSGAVTVDTSTASGNQNLLTFTTINWNTNQTVTVAAGDDDNAADETVNLTHGASGGGYGSLALASRPGVTVTTDDDDTAGIVLDADPSTGNMDEAGPLALNELSGHADNAKNYTVRLATQPTADVEVSVSSGDRAVAVDNDATPRTLTLTFTMSNWGTAQTVTATAAEDDDASNEQVAISHTATGGDYGGVTAQMVATTVDDDEPAIVMAATTLIGSGVTEGATATYTVRLDTEPAGEVRVTAMATGGVDVDMDPGQAGRQRWLRFDATTWNTARTVSVRGLEDDDGADGTATIRHSASGADYGRAPAAEIQFAVRDDDDTGIWLTWPVLNEGSSGEYFVNLATAPVGGPVELSATVADETVATVSPLTLTFDASDWNMQQRVQVETVGDGSTNVDYAASGADYDGVVGQTTVTVRDIDAAGVRLKPTEIVVREGGAAATYGIRLNTQPSGNVLVTPSAGTFAPELVVSGDGVALTFTSGDWDQERTVSVEVRHDDDARHEGMSVTHAVSGYAGVSSAPSLVVNVGDDDAAGIEFAPADGLSLTEGGAATATYTAVLTSEPTADVTVSLSSDDAGLAFDADDGTPGDQTALTFTMANWNTARTLAARAVADADAATEEVTLLHSASGGGYDGVVAAYEVRVSDADAAPAPARVEAAAAGETSLSVSWSASPGARGYWVQWRVVGGEWSLDRLIEVSATGSSASGGGRTLRVATGPLSARIDGLLPGQRYEVRVLPLNRGDPGNPSAVVSATPAAQRSGGAGAPQVANAPAALVLEAGGSADVDLSDAFRDPDGDALTYAAWSSNEDVVTVRVEADVLLVGAGRPGSARLTLEATDPGGLSAQTTVDVDVLGTQCKTEPAQAPEGGVAVATAELSEPARSLTTIRWRAGADADPATPGADAGEHGGASGEAVFNVGERCAEIEIPILDDAVAEPSREWFVLELELRFANLGRLTRQRIPVAVLEGVCDRTPAVRDALLTATGARTCEAPGPAELGGVRTLNLSGLDLPVLAAGDLGGLSSLRTLDMSNNALEVMPSLAELPRLERLLLSGNALSEVPSKTLASPSRLRDLNLSNNALEELPPEALANLPGLRVLRLDGNAIEMLPDGLLAGISELRLLRLDSNPGAPFALPLELERTDAEPWSPAPASVRVSAPSGAPFDLSVTLSVEGGTFADGATTAPAAIPAGETASPQLRVTAEGFARVSLSSPPFPSRLCLGQPCWRGFEFALGKPLGLFAREIEVSPPPQPEALFGDVLRVPLSSLAMAGEADGELLWSARSSDPSLATAHIGDGALVVEPAPGGEGVVEVEATATDRHGQTATVRFEVRVEFYWPTSPARGWRGLLEEEPR